jgi:hypothetical protein
MRKLKFNLIAYLSTAGLPGQTTKTTLTEEFMFQNVAYRPTVYITGLFDNSSTKYISKSNYMDKFMNLKLENYIVLYN